MASSNYLSLVNKSGSGFNVTELVDSMVAAQIEPQRKLEKTKLEKTESTISGIGKLLAQSAVSKKNFNTIKSDEFFSVSSSNTSGLGLSITDESKLSEKSFKISNVNIAKPMIFEIGGFTSLTGSFAADLTINFGEWSENAGVYSFTSTGSSSDLPEFSNKTLQQVAAIIDGVSGLSAKIVDKTGDSDSYSLVISSENTGSSNGFQIIDSLATKDGRWETPPNPAADIYDNTFTQLASNASFVLDGVAVTRSSNNITDIISGATLDLKSDFSSEATLNVSQSKTAIMQTARDVIFSLNELKAELDTLTEIVLDGQNGPLATDPTARLLKSKLKKLAVEPFDGYGPSSFYLSNLGIKTTASGEYYLDEKVFDQTFTRNPEYFVALKNDNISSPTNFTTLSKSEFTTITSGSYTVSNSSGSWKFGDTALTQSNLSSGGSEFTSSTYPGLYIATAERTPEDFTVYVGKSLANKIIDLMDETLKLDSDVNNSKNSYDKVTNNIQERLDKLQKREELLTGRLTVQFGNMERSMTNFNGTKSLLENLVASWNQK